MTTLDDIYRRGIDKKFRYKSLNEILSIISEETLGPRGYKVFFDSKPDDKLLIFSYINASQSNISHGIIQLSRRFNGSIGIPIDVYHYDSINSNGSNRNGHNHVIFYSDEEYREDALLLADSIRNQLGYRFEVSLRNQKKNGNGSNGNGHH